MTRIWRRHRTWFFAVTPGLALATVLWIWFTPQPERIVDLQEMVHTESARMRVSACDEAWVAIESRHEAMTPWPTTFVNCATGATRSWDLSHHVDGIAFGYALEPNGSGTFRVVLLDYDLRPTSVHWFNPETRASGSVDIPRFRQSHQEPFGYDYSEDGSAIVQARYGQEGFLEFQLADLRTGEASETVTLPGFVRNGMDTIYIALSPDASQVAIRRKIGGVYLVEIRQAGDGTLIEQLDIPTLSSWPKPDDARLTLRRTVGGSTFEVIDSAGTVLHQCPDHEALRHLPPFCGNEPAMAKPRLVQNTTGILCMPRGENPSRTEEVMAAVREFAAKVPVSIPVKPQPSDWGCSAYWYDWKSGNLDHFRRKAPDEVIHWDAICAGNRISLLINPEGPNPRLEVWSAPPPRRPVLGIWIVSLLVTYATWFWLKRRQRADPTTSATAAAAAG